MNIRFKFPLLLSLFLASSLPLGAQNFPVSKIEKMDAASYLKPLPQNGVVQLKEIASDFATNSDAAIGKYSGRRITVIGRVSALSNGNGENKVLVVTLQGTSGDLPAVKADFLYGSIPENSEIQISNDGSSATIVHRDRRGDILSQDTYLNVDQNIAIEGTFKEVKVGDIVLTACNFASKGK
jgi:hypothetical protein